MLSSGLYESALGGAVGGLVASLVYALLAAAYRYWIRPEFRVTRCNVKLSPAGVEFFDLVITNTGETPFLEPTLNVDGFGLQTVTPSLANASWTPEGKLILPYHKALAPQVSIRVTFQVCNRAALGDTVRVTMLHLYGVEVGPTIAIGDLKTMR